MSRAALRVLLATSLFASLSYQPASAEEQPAQICVKRTDLLRQLSNKFNETPVAIGLTDSGSVLEVYSTSDGATWTIGLTTPNGLTCLVATGEGWENVPRLAHVGPPA